MPTPILRDPTVTIIVNNYNYERYVGQALESALLQTYRALEVIVVDDGSTDDSVALLTKVTDQRFTLITKTNGGQASAFNAGFASSHGEIILFLDSDDIIFPDCIERVVAEWKPDLSKLHFALSLIDEKGKLLGRREPPNRKLPSGRLAAELALKGGYLSPPSSGNVYSRSFLEKVMPIVESEWRGYADMFLFHLAPFYGSIGAIDRELGCYRVHARSMSVLVVDGKFRVQSLQKDILLDAKVSKLIKPYRETELNRVLDEDSASYHKLRSRLISMKLSPQTHPHAGDKASKLLVRTLRQAWHTNEITSRRKTLFTLWIIMVALLPKRLVELIVIPVFRQRSCSSSVAHLRP